MKKRVLFSVLLVISMLAFGACSNNGMEADSTFDEPTVEDQAPEVEEQEPEIEESEIREQETVVDIDEPIADELGSEPEEQSLDLTQNEAALTEFKIQVALQDDADQQFNSLNQVDYNEAFEELRGFSFDGMGENIVIWGNQAVTDLSLVAFDHGVEDFYISDFIPLATSMDFLAGDALLLTNYYGMGTMPWSGISLVDANGIQHFYLIIQSGYDGSFLLQPFEPANNW